MTEGAIEGRLFGIETEYGILVEGRGAEDLMEESRLLVRAYPGTWAGPWDYRAEDPRRDMRGFQVDHLNYDREDARYDRTGPASHLSAEEQRSDRALTNGARLYNDHGHPEYATPECRSSVTWSPTTGQASGSSWSAPVLEPGKRAGKSGSSRTTQ